MKFEKPFHIKLQPYYVINEPSSIDEIHVMNETSKELGGIGMKINQEEEIDPETKIYRSGGRMNWNLYNEGDSQKPEINVHLMRIWALQMVTQMINEKAYVNEINSEPKFNIDEENKNIFLNVITEMTFGLHKELEKEIDSIVRMKKYKFKFEENGE